MSTLLDREPDEAPSPELEAASERSDRRLGALIAFPSYAYLVVFFAIPFLIVAVVSFASRSSTGRTEFENWNIDSYLRLLEPQVRSILWTSLSLAIVATVISLVVSYPFAYYIATRRPAVRNLLLVLVMIPFWSNFLVRTYTWKVILGSDGPLSQLSQAFGGEGVRLLFTNTAVMIGLVYGYLPFMVLPLFAALERMDWSLVEAARDLYASGWNAFRRITLPISMPGVIAGSILVFIPALGAYVTPSILGGGDMLLGQYIVNQFLTARNWPFGAALSVAIMTVMLGATLIYFRSGGKNL